jgi:hypothetical protein
MQGKVISIRLNMDKLTDRKTDEVLSSLPNRRKSEYIRNAIIAYNNQENLLELMKQVMIGAMDEWDAKQAGKKNGNSKSINGYVDYLESL